MVEFWKQSEKLYSRLIGKNQIQFMKGKINGCCKQPENLYLADRDEAQKLTTWRCKVCGRAHRVLQAEPGRIGFTGGDIGR